ncbi:MAG TPA: spore coat protein CotH [Bacteroidales bacterium]|nr:spore coat protein CotH [Bacteroidales bacterium]HBZ20430.1 spore coat protein CotH [Bacteroidales bacterium]
MPGINFNQERFIALLFSLIITIKLNSQIGIPSQLPLIVIETGGESISADSRITAWLKVINNGPGALNSKFQNGTDYDGRMGIKIRGQSSQMFPKKSYSLELRARSGADTTASLLGMPGEEDWVLYAPYSDKTMLRNALTFHLGSRLGGWQSRNRWCEVYLNGDYIGIYQLMESIKRDSNRVDISKLKPDELSGDDLTGGYIFKADKIDFGSSDFFQIFPSTHYHNSDNYRFTYVYPEYDEIGEAQKSYIKKFVTDAENSLNGSSFSDPSSGFRKFMDVNSFVDFQIIQELVNNVDGYRFSTFFYKDKDSKGGKLHAGPLWDFDLCYGNEDYTDLNLDTDIWLYSKFEDKYGGRMHWWARLMEDLGYRGVFVSHWKEIRKAAFSTDSIMNYLDGTIEYLGDAINRNFTRWPIIGKYVWPNYFVGETYEEEVGYLKEWITARLNWMDANIMLAENVSENYAKNEILVFPNPVRDQINLYFYLSFSGEIRIELFDLMGRKALIKEDIPEYTGYQYLSIDINNLASGYYILQVSQGKRQIGRRNILVTGK